MSSMDTDDDFERLKSVPGFGDILSSLVKVEIGDISRFHSSSHLCSYAGLVPSTYSSGGKTRHGKITKQGNKWLRWATIEAVIPATSSNTEIHQFYNRIKRQKGSKAAKVATARRLLTIVYRSVKYKDSFKEFLKDVYYNNASKSESPSKFFRVS
jgi:transposase